ncbi:MAG: J domain-containing protein [Deltaproteobacteria bacterium]|nr:J domain-containing protein [Deltaproteobacteria bacterium]
MSKLDPYGTLGVARTATAEEIRTAYRKLARKYHPDVNPGDKAAEAHFKEVAAAYDVLSDEQKRKNFDEFGADALHTGFDPDQARAYKRWQEARAHAPPPRAHEDAFDWNLEDLLGQFGAGGPSGSRRGGPRRGPDATGEVDLDFMQALHGAEVTLTVPGVATPLRVRIPPGADDGSQVTLRGQGAPGPGGGPPGDVIIRTRVRPHPVFRREGLDLVLDLPVTLSEAYNGATVDVPTPGGPVKMKIPPRTQSGTRLRLRGKGVARGGQVGDLFAVAWLRLPEAEDRALGEALRAADALYARPPREGMDR